MKSLALVTEQINGVLTRSRRFRIFFDLIQVLLCGILGVNIWSLVEPERTSHHWIFGLGIAFLAFLLKKFPREKNDLTVGEVSLAIDIEDQLPVSEFKHAHTLEERRLELAKAHLEKLFFLEKIALKRHALTLVVPLVFIFGTMGQAMGSFKGAITAVTNAASRLTRGVKLTVVYGGVDDLQQEKTFELSAGNPKTLELLAQNLLKIEVSGMQLGDGTVALELRRIPDGENSKIYKEELFQGFQMIPQRTLRQTEDPGKHSITLSVSESLALYIPVISDSMPLAIFNIKQLPVPVVTLSLEGKTQDPWPDDQILPLNIKVNSTYPIQLVRLLVKTGQQTSPVLVANVVGEDRLQLNLDYRLLLESYVEADYAQVEITAEAIDHAVPKPLVGRSNPLLINTASAYGRYREALSVIRAIKGIIDEAIEKDAGELSPDVIKMADEMLEKSEKSPFFDGVDRINMGRFASMIEEFQNSKNGSVLHELSQRINEFLFEHEIIDDRERDRDFFVAARSLSRLIEQPTKKRAVRLEIVEQRLEKFLDERAIRWRLRVDRLPKEMVPSQYAEIEQGKIFHKAVRESVDLDEAAQKSPEIKSKQLTLLSKAVVDYRKWIQDLEQAEDKSRAEQDRERQEGIASARNVLKELQKRQGEVSGDLDRAADRSTDDLKQAWIGSRLKQNTNIRETKRVENQLRSLSPSAGIRIQYAIQAMEETNQSGDLGQFAEAESSADLAGRLLRQADAAAQESQQRRRSRGGRRRVTGDHYYGQSVVGGDIEIKRGYEVDRRYREDILDDLEQTQVGEDDRKLLENYLRAIVR